MTGDEGPARLPARLDVGLVLHNQVQRLGIERMLEQAPAVGRIRILAGLEQVPAEPPDVLCLAHREVTPAVSAGVGALVARGVHCLLLVDAFDLQDVESLVEMGVHGCGFVAVDEISASSLSDALYRLCHGTVPMPDRLTRRLLALARDRTAAGPAARRVVRLTPRERQALALLVDGLSNKQIALRLGISGHGAKRLVASIMAKLDAPNRTTAVARVLREGLLQESVAAR